MKVIEVRNFRRYQHYKSRNPAWIKLYWRLWQDRAFYRLSDVSRSHLLGLFALASQHGNAIEFDPEWIEHQLSTTGIDWEALRTSGFIKVVVKEATTETKDLGEKKASNMLAECKQDFSESVCVSVSSSVFSSSAKNVPEKPDPEQAMKEMLAEAEGSVEFERFWVEYPCQIDKEQARSEYLRARSSSDWPGLDAVMAALGAWKSSDRWSDTAYVPYPAKWLRMKRWRFPPKPQNKRETVMDTLKRIEIPTGGSNGKRKAQGVAGQALRGV